MMGYKPLLDALGFSIREKINQAMRFQIDDDRSIAFSPFPGKIVDPNRLHVAHGWSRHEVQRVQKRHSRKANAQLLGQTSTSLGIECSTDRLHDASQTSGESR